MTIITRSGKGSQLTHTELDTNFTDLRDGLNARLPKTSGTGIKIGGEGDDTFGWHDLTGPLQIDSDDANRALMQTYRGVLKQRQFIEAVSEAYVDFHIPHDYLPGSAIYIHAHWSHNSALVTGGSVTWKFDAMYAKGHTQQAFSAPVPITVAQSANTTQYMHMIAETAASTPGGSAVQLDTDLMEVDGIIQCLVSLDSNDITSSGAVPDPFVHQVDIHYQSIGAPTKQRAPDFYT